MSRRLSIATAAIILAGALCAGTAAADAFRLRSYMPLAPGMIWKMDSRAGEETEPVTVEVLDALDVNGVAAWPIVTKDADGDILRGTLEAIGKSSYELFGWITGAKGMQHSDGAVKPILYDPVARFPGRLSVGQTVETPATISMGHAPTELTVSIELAAVESVTVPGGTFADCLKIVYTTEWELGKTTRIAWYAKGIGMVKIKLPGTGTRPTTIIELVELP